MLFLKEALHIRPFTVPQVTSLCLVAIDKKRHGCFRPVFLQGCPVHLDAGWGLEVNRWMERGEGFD